MLLTDLLSLFALSVTASPAQEPVSIARKQRASKYFDVQAHRGGRGNTVENTLPSFAWGLIDGATTLELDNGITKDGHVVVWHDEEIFGSKCVDTAPALKSDPDFPYVGKYIANLTLTQLKTLDCGSKRQNKYPLQLTFPNTRISTLREVFSFVSCADPSRQVLWNIESKIDAADPNRTKGVMEFVKSQYEVFVESGYKYAITYQSFDWRTLVEMKKLDRVVTTSALISDATAFPPPTSPNAPSPWLAGLRLSDFNGSTLGARIAQAAHSISADVLSPADEMELEENMFDEMELEENMFDENGDVRMFASVDMVKEAKRLGMEVKPWTVNKLDMVEQLMSWRVDGIITDYPNAVRRWAKQHGYRVAPKFPKQRVLACLEQHMQSNAQTQAS